MYLFSRQAILTGGERRPLGWAVEITGYINDHSDHDVSLWQAQFGLPVGTVAWSTWAESHESLMTGFAGLIEDDGYHTHVEKGVEFVAGPPEDSLRQVVHGEPAAERPPIGSVTTIVTATMAGGKYNDAVAWGTDMAQLVQEVTQLPSMFLIDAYGTFGQVTWLTGAPDLATADTAANALNFHDKYLKSLGDVGELFVPASGRRALAIRIA
jgi:hypothetical protein